MLVSSASATYMTHTIAMGRDGSIWAWGGAACLGLGDIEDRDRPTRIGGDSDWVAAAAGAVHSVALKRDGSRWAWGCDHRGQLGLGGVAIGNRPAMVSRFVAK